MRKFSEKHLKLFLLGLVMVLSLSFLNVTGAFADEKTSVPAGVEVKQEQAIVPPAVIVQPVKPLPIDKGDTAWLLVSTALVMLMTPGLALFYGGMVRAKNILGTVMQSFVALGVVTIVWFLYGYSLAFGPDKWSLIGGLDYIGLKGVGMAPCAFAPTVPHLVFMAFQCMFAVITPALITGAFAERFRFRTYLVFLVIWLTVVYCPLAHWVWGGGWIGSKLGALDFAGGLVVHISSGASALAAALLIGKRKDYGVKAIPPHNLVLTLIGASLLWFGWFGFNAGSALTANGLAAVAFVTTHIATAAALLTWMFAEWLHKSKPTALGAASGAVAGLVAITPACGFVTPFGALMIGAIAGVVCYIAVNLKTVFGYDDSLDTVGVHGVGGTLGALATGLFACAAINGKNGLFYGSSALIMPQFISVVVAWTYSFVLTIIILKILDATMGIRITDEEEHTGLDLSEHGERAYSL